MANAFTNVLSTLATDPVRNFRFLVEFLPPTGGVTPTWSFDAKMGFTSVSGLTVATEAIQYREGGYNTTLHQLPGQTSFSPVTLILRFSAIQMLLALLLALQQMLLKQERQQTHT